MLKFFYIFWPKCRSFAKKNHLSKSPDNSWIGHWFSYTGNAQDENQKGNRFCVWITSEPCPLIPSFLLQNLHKIAWNHITEDVVDSKTMKDENKEAEGGNQAPKAPLAIAYRSPGTYLHSGKYIPVNTIWQKFTSFLFISCSYQLYISNRGIIYWMCSRYGHAKLYYIFFLFFPFHLFSLSKIFFTTRSVFDNEWLWQSFLSLSFSQQLCLPLNKFLQSPLSPRWSALLHLVLASYRECWWLANCLELRASTSGIHSTRFRWNRLWW